MTRVSWAMLAALVVMSAALVMVACGGGSGGDARPKRLEPPPEAVTKVTEHGAVKATIVLWPPAPRLGDAIYLRLTIEQKPGAPGVTAPFQHEALGRFAVSGWTPGTQRRDDGTMVEEQTYTLEAPGSGKFRIPPLRLVVGSGDQAEEVLTEELPITIAPVDPARAHEPLAAERGALPPHRTVNYLPLFIVAGPLFIGLVVLIVVLVGAARRRAVRQARVTAYDEAVRRLEALAARGAPDEGAMDSWYVELSSIVRRYLEGRYGVRAPELTTEEFLQEAQRAAALAANHRELLTAFLERCDRVKFAGYRPDSDESMATLKAARAFVEDTRVRAQEAA
ncbi:MAG TPA: hypothetical protein VM261_21785 [Kofleriaceae bacterium]|nr:hypothetical protein [Kofleriaceae bacterium]